MVEKTTAAPKVAALRAVPRRGQGMTEYIIVVALIAIAAIGVVTLFGDNIKALFGASADALSGSTSVTNRGTASNVNLEKKKVTNFGQNNSGY